jgi:hypothetical protein
MGRLLAAGILYLIGVAIVLTIKPDSMFAEDGSWKEFGIGRNPKTHSWIPFWLFAVLWALVSYILVTVGFAMAGIQTQSSPFPTIASSSATAPVKEPAKVEVIDDVLDVEADDFDLPPIPPKPRGRRSRGIPMDLPDGYYVLNTRATEAAGGIPKYVYLGRGLPE